MTITQLEDFSSYNNIETFRNNSSMTWNEENPIRVSPTGINYDNNTWGTGNTIALSSVFTNDEERVFYGRIKAGSDGGSTGLNQLMLIYVFDGTNYMRLGVDKASGSVKHIFAQTDTMLRVVGSGNGSNSIVNTWTDNTWMWFRMVITATTVACYYALTNSTVKPDDDEWTLAFTITVSLGTLTEMGCHYQANSPSIDDDHQWDDLEIEIPGINPSPVGFDASIKFTSIYLRTALNAGGNSIFKAQNPFHTVTSAATLKAQLKKEITFTNNFSKVLWQGEAATLQYSLHQAEYEGEEMLRKTMFTEVGDTPIIFSTFIRQVQGLVLVDKDARFVSRGVTTSHLVSFAKSAIKSFEARSNSDTFLIRAEDQTTPYVPNTVSNDKDEEMYYFDDWDSDDTDKAHIVINQGTNPPFVVQYPINLYEKFNNLTKLNKLEMVLTISAIRGLSTDWTNAGGGDADYVVFAFNYHTTAYEVIERFGKSALSGDSTISTVDAGARFYDPRTLTINIAEKLKENNSLYDSGTAYVIGDRAISDETLYTCISNTTGNTPPNVTFWQRTVYDFINYESTAGSDSDFSKQNTIISVRTADGAGTTRMGFWMWALSMRGTFDEDNEPEFSSASISAVTETTLTLNQTSGKNLPYEDGFGVDDIMAIVKNIEDYLQDTWDASTLAVDLGPLNINITNSTAIGVVDDHTYKSFHTLMQHIGDLANSTYFADYDPPRSVEIVSADNHVSSGIILTADDVEDYFGEGWYISEDATKQRNKIRILGDNVNFVKTLAPALDPFDLGDETEIINDSSVQTLLQASDLADAMTPRMEGNEVISNIILNYSFPNQNYFNIEVGKTVAVLLPSAADTSIANYKTGGDGELLIIAIEANQNEGTGGEWHATLTLQKRYS